jgi:hypothetical protein
MYERSWYSKCMKGNHLWRKYYYSGRDEVKRVECIICGEIKTKGEKHDEE